MKRWGLRASSLSAVAKADAGQNASRNHKNRNVLYTMIVPGYNFLILSGFCLQSNTDAIVIRLSFFQ
jgi:hypothetical protein